MKKRQKIRALAGLAAAAMAALPCGAAAHPPLAGIYVVATAIRRVGPDQGIDQSLRNPLIDGAYISLNWNTIEPAPGQFDWSVMDAELAVVAADHKKASLAVVPGEYTPAWVYAAGARQFNTVVEPSFARDFCAPVRFPIPWDPVYLNAWTGLVAAFGAHYADNPIVSAIKITGVSYRTDETSLAFGTYMHLAPNRVVVSPRTGAPCVIPDDIAEWQADGYSWAKVDGAFGRIVAAFKAAFPGLPMGIMTSDHTFPPLSPDGSTPDPAGYALATTDFFQIGRRQLGDNFFGQFNGLSGRQVNAGIVAFAASNPTGYQTGMPSHGDPFCIMNARQMPCDEQQDFQNAMNEALGAHARFIEVFHNDATFAPFQPILAQAHQALMSP